MPRRIAAAAMRLPASLAFSRAVPHKIDTCVKRRRFVMDFAEARSLMVEGQVRTYDVTDLRVLAAMLQVPGERFLPVGRQELAYLDRDIDVRKSGPAGGSRFLLKPAVVAKLIQAAEVGAGDHVLDVGCASGYSSALLSRLAATVVALEED